MERHWDFRVFVKRRFACVIFDDKIDTEVEVLVLVSFQGTANQNSEQDMRLLVTHLNSTIL